MGANGTKDRVTVEVRSEFEDGIWSVDVWVNDEMVGCGTSPNGPMDIVSDVLYGDKNDWLNGNHGALGFLKETAQ